MVSVPVPVAAVVAGELVKAAAVAVAAAPADSCAALILSFYFVWWA